MKASVATWAAITVRLHSSGGQMLEVQLNPQSKIKDLKEHIASLWGIPELQQKLTFEGQKLADYQAVSTYQRGSGIVELDLDNVAPGDDEMSKITRSAILLESPDNLERARGVRELEAVVRELRKQDEDDDLPERVIGLIKMRLEHPLSQTRRAGVDALGRVTAGDSDAQTLQLFISMLEDRDVWVRMQAWETLAQVAPKGDADTVFRLTKLLGSRRADVRIAAIMALTHVAKPGDAGVVFAITKALDDQNEDVAFASSEALLVLNRA